MAILEVNNLTKRFEGVMAVAGLSLGFEQGQITGLVGPNGSGKTTLTNLLSGLTGIDSGAVVVAGRSLTSTQPWQILGLGLTRTFQEVRLFNQMTVLDNILVVLTERGIFSSLFEKHPPQHLTTAEDILKTINLWEKRGQLAINLSYGQRKLLEIARACTTKAQIYLFDEPFAGLFPEMVKIIKSLIVEMKAAGKTIILIEHDMAIIRELADRVVVMDAGKLLAEGQPEEVLNKREVIEAYLGE